ncbi:hypothetical protein LZ31DRAFT_82275 [Colletotrichum somersetense]|nr:hypothetical protein LZ31DRAFT_82275 [Colletotrichum somersetense]
MGHGTSSNFTFLICTAASVPSSQGHGTRGGWLAQRTCGGSARRPRPQSAAESRYQTAWGQSLASTQQPNTILPCETSTKLCPRSVLQQAHYPDQAKRTAVPGSNGITPGWLQSALDQVSWEVGRNILDQSLSCCFSSEGGQGSSWASRMTCLPARLTRLRGRAGGLQLAGQGILTPWH